MTIIIFFILGLIVGSFLNVLVYRLRTAETLFWDRSKCPRCRHYIRWYDNIPLISFILLGAQCRDCRKKISWQYPLVESATALIFILIGNKFFAIGDPASYLATAYGLAVSSALIAILVYDWLYLEIPTVMLWFGITLAIAFNLIIDWHQTPSAASVFESKTYSGILAGFSAFLFFFLLAWKSKEKWMGMGDAYLVIFIGLFLGWPRIILVLFSSFLIGSIYGIILVILKKKELKSQIPFAPFLVLGTFLALFFYSPIANWYWKLLM